MIEQHPLTDGKIFMFACTLLFYQLPILGMKHETLDIVLCVCVVCIYIYIFEE